MLDLCNCAKLVDVVCVICFRLQVSGEVRMVSIYVYLLRKCLHLANELNVVVIQMERKARDHRFLGTVSDWRIAYKFE